MDRLYLADVAAKTGLAPHTIAAYRSRPLAINPFPVPDDFDSHRPWWFEATIDTWLAARPGRGWRAGHTTVKGLTASQTASPFDSRDSA